MNFQILWTQESKVSFAENIFYLETNWSEKVIANFMEETEKCIEVLRSNIYAGIYDPNLKCRKILVTEQIYLLYEVYEDTQTIYLLSFWNNYRKPITLL